MMIKLPPLDTFSELHVSTLCAYIESTERKNEVLQRHVRKNKAIQANTHGIATDFA